MDIVSLSISRSMANVQNDVQIAMLSKSLDNLETTGEGIQKMMEASVTPYLGQNIDISFLIFFSVVLPQKTPSCILQEGDFFTYIHL